MRGTPGKASEGIGEEEGYGQLEVTTTKCERVPSLGKSFNIYMVRTTSSSYHMVRTLFFTHVKCVVWTIVNSIDVYGLDYNMG